MSDSSFYDGQREVNVDSITTLSEPNQQLANAIATGPQDEFFSLLENINCDMGRHYGSESVHIGVTNAWNWKPGTYDKVRLVMNKMLRLNDKAANVTKFLSRTQEHSRWYIDRLRRSFQDAEELKARLKREGYTVDVDIDEYTGKLTEFADKVQEECNKASTTFDNVIITPYIHLSNNERDSKFYLEVTISNLTLSIFQQETLIQEINLEPIKIIFQDKLRDIMKHTIEPRTRRTTVGFRGLYMSPEIEYRNSSYSHLFHFPYISSANWRYNSIGDDRFPVWGAVCFDRYLDEIKTSFSKVNYTSLIMSIFSWAQYYNTEYSNPYNQPYLLHFGMPKEMNDGYKNSFPNSARQCATRIECNYKLNSGISFSDKHLQNRVDALQICDSIDCQWTNTCDLFKNSTQMLDIILNEDAYCKWESILGYLTEHFNDTDLLTQMIEDYYGLYYIDSVYFIRNCLYSHTVEGEPQAINLLTSIEYWGKEEIIKDVIPNNDKIKEQMLQWATERRL